MKNVNKRQREKPYDRQLVLVNDAIISASHISTRSSVDGTFREHWNTETESWKKKLYLSNSIMGIGAGILLTSIMKNRRSLTSSLSTVQTNPIL